MTKIDPLADTRCTEPMPDPLAVALLEAQRKVRDVTKDGENTFHRYKYVTSEQMIGVSRDALAEAELTLDATDWSFSISGTTTAETRKGNVELPYGFVTMRMVLVHGPTGVSMRRSVDWPAHCEPGRPWDKAVAGALTTCLSYWLRGLLLIPRVDANEADCRDDTGYGNNDDQAPPQQQQRQHKRNPPAPTNIDKMVAAVMRDGLNAESARLAIAAYLDETMDGMAINALLDNDTYAAVTSTIKERKNPTDGSEAKPVVWPDWADAAAARAEDSK